MLLIDFPGVFGTLLALLLGVASLPGVSGAMTWREFSFVQSRVGWFLLLLGTAHVLLIGWTSLWQPSFRCYVVPSFSQVRP